MSGHVSNQSGTQLPGVSQQNGNVAPNMVAAGSGAPHPAFSADTDLHGARNFMKVKIFFLLAQRHHQPINDSQMQKLKDVVEHLEELLFKSAQSKEEYMNLGTMESRLFSLVKRPPLNNRNPVNPNMVAAGSGTPHPALSADTDLHGARNFMKDKIFFFLTQRRHQPINDSQMQKLKDVVKHLEELLFKSAQSKEEYMNLGTMESRLFGLVKHPSLNNRNPVNPNSMTTMIPTPGLSHNGSSTIISTSSVDAPMSNMAGSSSMQPTNANTGSLMSSGVMHNGSFTIISASSVDAPMSNTAGSSSMQPTNPNMGSLMSSGVMESSPYNRTDLCEDMKNIRI